MKNAVGKGITVQINSQTYGFIEMCEVTDELQGNVFQFLAQKVIFPARVIGFDKNGKIQLSSRESVVDGDKWKNTKPDGPSIRFQDQDAPLQA